MPRVSGAGRSAPPSARRPRGGPFRLSLRRPQNTRAPLCTLLTHDLTKHVQGPPSLAFRSRAPASNQKPGALVNMPALSRPPLWAAELSLSSRPRQSIPTRNTLSSAEIANCPQCSVATSVISQITEHFERDERCRFGQVSVVDQCAKPWKTKTSGPSVRRPIRTTLSQLSMLFNRPL